MREILFKAKKVDNGEWVEGNYFIDERDIEDGYIWRDVPQIQERYGDHYNYWDIIPETVGQCTGLTDKNGTKIFEGDIVHCDATLDSANMVVIFEDGEFRLVLCEKYETYIPSCGFYCIRNFSKEVIGNIHERKRNT